MGLNRLVWLRVLAGGLGRGVLLWRAEGDGRKKEGKRRDGDRRRSISTDFRCGGGPVGEAVHGHGGRIRLNVKGGGQTLKCCQEKHAGEVFMLRLDAPAEHLKTQTRNRCSSLRDGLYNIDVHHPTTHSPASDLYAHPPSQKGGRAAPV